MSENALAEHLTEDLIQLRVVAPDWRAAVRAAGELLVRNGKCEAHYIEAMIEAVEEMGPYMVLAPGLALAHARPEDGVLDMGISLVTLDPPVEFGSEANDPVSLVIAFGGVDHKSHIALLADLARFLEDEERREDLSRALDVDEVLQAIRSF
jgi:PTS system ascorbate-specific IIA component